MQKIQYKSSMWKIKYLVSSMWKQVSVLYTQAIRERLIKESEINESNSTAENQEVKDQEENELEWTNIHKNYISLMDELLVKKLKKETWKRCQL